MSARKRFPQPGRYFFIYPHRMYSYTVSSRVLSFLSIFPQLPRVMAPVCTWSLLDLGSSPSARAGSATQKCDRCSASGITTECSYHVPHSSSRSCSFPLDRMWNNFPHLLLTQWVWDFVDFTMILRFLPNLFQEVKKNVDSVTDCF